jgi:hypothetical protein
MAQSPVELQPMDSAASNANLRSFKSNASLKARWRKSNYRGNLQSHAAQKVDTSPDVTNEEDVLLLSETGLHQEEQNGDFDGGWKASSPTSNPAAASSCAQHRAVLTLAIDY